MHGDIALEKQSVNHQTIAAVKGLFALQIKHDQVVVNDRTTSNLFDHQVGMFQVMFNLSLTSGSAKISSIV